MEFYQFLTDIGGVAKLVLLFILGGFMLHLKSAVNNGKISVVIQSRTNSSLEKENHILKEENSKLCVEIKEVRLTAKQMSEEVEAWQIKYIEALEKSKKEFLELKKEIEDEHT